MHHLPPYFQNENELEEALAAPGPEVVEAFSRLEGDLMFLGVAGKIGISLARMAAKACELAGVKKKIFGVSRFSSEQQRRFLEDSGITTLQGDLLEADFLHSLPQVANVWFLAGMKFGTQGNEAATWAMNSYLPGLVAETCRDSRIVAYSTGCVYPLVPCRSGGSTETDPVEPVGEYAQSCLGRERLFTYGSEKYGTQLALIRLFYAVEMRYGVLVDIASKVMQDEPVDVSMGYANVIWQGDANAMILRAIHHCKQPPMVLNITGPELVSVRETALKFGKLLGRQVKLTGTESETALLGNAEKSFDLFGRPTVDLDQLMEWTARWIAGQNRLLGKPTHFEVRDGKY